MQQTLRTSIQMKGRGRQCHKLVHLRLRPAPVNSGLVFQFAGRATDCIVRAGLDCACEEQGLVLSAGRERLRGVAPLLAALYVLGIDNARIELDADEVPDMDGSAAPFVFLIQAAGVRPQNALCREIKLAKSLRVTGSQGWARFLPSSGLRIACLKQDGISLEQQDTLVEISKASFISRLCHAGAYRHRDLDECHHMAGEWLQSRQILETLADISLLNARVHGTYIGFRAGHAVSLRLMKQLEATLLTATPAAPEADDNLPLLVNTR